MSDPLLIDTDVLIDYLRARPEAITYAVIAATAQQYNATLVTLNRKHYPMLTTIIVPYKKQ